MHHFFGGAYIQYMKRDKPDPLFNEFCVDRNLSETSVKHYKWALNKYSDFNDKSLTE